MNKNEYLAAFFTAARHCAMEMASNAEYIRNELPHVTLPPGLGETLIDACDELVSAKFDVISELSGLDDLLGTEGGSPEILAKLERILTHMDDAAIRLHPVVMTLGEAAAGDSRYGLAFLLVAESAVNVLGAHEAIPRIDVG